MSSKDAVDSVIDGKYKIDKQLGKGGMGTVFLATHIGTGRSVAVKVIASEFTQRHEFVERFRREAQAAGRLRHPNVVDVTDFGFSVGEDGKRTAYLVMEYLDGCTLGEVLEEEGSLPVDFTVDILEQVCSAVNEAHRQGIIHRDLKPDNIWLEPNQRGGYTVKVLDFGIAKLEETRFEALAESSGQFLVRDQSKTRLGNDGQTQHDAGQTEIDPASETMVGEGETLALNVEDGTSVGSPSEAGTMIQTDEIVTAKDDPGKTSVLSPVERQQTKVTSETGITDDSPAKSSGSADLTRAGAVLGTPLYMSPEQCRGEKLTAGSDIYSLAVIVYQMLSGKLPFTGDYVEVMKGHKEDCPPPLENRKIPENLKSIVMTALSKDIAERPDSAEALASKLRSNSDGLGVLIRRAVVIYSEYLPKFLLLTVIAYLPFIVVTYARVIIRFFFAAKVFENGVLETANSAGLGILAFFLQIITIAILMGMTTWIVGQIIAFPLRPISLRAAFKQVKLRWKQLVGTVTLSTFVTFFGWILGAIAGVIGGVHFLALIGGLFGGTASGVSAVVFMMLGMFFGGAALSSLLMLIAPSIMMEGISGIAAFKRSKELTLRSFRTVFPTALLSIIIPVMIAGLIGLSVSSIIASFELSQEVAQMKRDGVVAQPDADKNKKEMIEVSPSKVTINTGDDDEKDGMAKKFTSYLREAITDIIWTPIAILFSSFVSVITALIYFKTRQAGGESLQHLLGKLDDADELQSQWERRVRERLIQSGRVTTDKGNSQG